MKTWPISVSISYLRIFSFQHGTFVQADRYVSVSISYLRIFSFQRKKRCTPASRDYRVSISYLRIFSFQPKTLFVCLSGILVSISYLRIFSFQRWHSCIEDVIESGVSISYLRIFSFQPGYPTQKPLKLLRFNLILENLFVSTFKVPAEHIVTFEFQSHT